ncbi:MAG: ABC transporter permease [Deltaproteobacteria bacterium]|nr:ABC transporter permease [Deltaproteobacteria bacterium]
MDSLWADIRYAVRMMVKAPAMTAVLAITLALGIGASTTIFSVVNSVVVRPLPYEHPGELVRTYTEVTGEAELSRFFVSPPEFDDLRRDCRSSCAAVAAWASGTASIAGGDRPVHVEATYATHELLPLLGVRPLLGRWFDESEDRPGDPGVIVLGYNVWQRAFGGDPGVVGRTIHVDAMPMTVVGVMPKGFEFIDRHEAWLPLNLDVAHADRAGHYLNVMIRLAPGATISSFRSELAALVASWQKSGRERHSLHTTDHPMIAVPFHADLVGSLATTLWLLQGAVLFVLLISIVNVANLLLARAETRTREVAVRHALGASRRRLVRQFLTESVLQGVLGGALGLIVAVWGVDAVRALIPASAPRASEISLDGSAIVFAVGCALFASLLFGMAPIFHARRTHLYASLKDGSKGMTATRAKLRVRRSLVIGEIALAFVLVIGCVVMVRSFNRLQHVDLGMKPGNMVTFTLELPPKTYPQRAGGIFWDRLQERLRALPGVKSASLIGGDIPSRPLNVHDVHFVGRTPVTREMAGQLGVPPWTFDYWQRLGDGAIETLGARIVRGRDISRADDADAPGVVLINEAFAKKFYPDEDPIGRQIMLAGVDPVKDPRQTIIGVVADIKNAGADKPAGAEVLVPWRQWPQYAQGSPSEFPIVLTAIVRTARDPATVKGPIHALVSELDPSLPVVNMRTMNDTMWEAIARPRFLAFLLTCFAGIALLLAAVGIYGVMAHTVAQRTQELGLRVALGAQPRQVRALVLRQAAVLVGVGVTVGLSTAIALQLALDQLLRGLFYGAELSQPLLLAAVGVAVTVTALLATWVPARRATKLEPTLALRSE